jgi:hypothetical protein
VAHPVMIVQTRISDLRGQLSVEWKPVRYPTAACSAYGESQCAANARR